MALVQTRQQGSADESGIFFSRFVEENAPDIADVVISDSGRTTSSSDVNEVARELDAIADSFANSPERQRLRETAQRAARNGISFSQIKDIIAKLMRQVVQGARYLVERLVVCFFFCLDLLKGVAKWAWGKIRQFFSWCKNAIVSVAGAIISAVGGLFRLIGSGVCSIVGAIFG